MDEQMDTKAIQPSATLGLLLAPLAVLLALATTRVVGIEYELMNAVDLEGGHFRTDIAHRAID